jgi:hypothetical protein
MMAELKRKEDQLTTADLAGRTEAPKPAREIHEMPPPDRPKPVRGEMEPKPMHSGADLKRVRNDSDVRAGERTPVAATPGSTAETTPSPLFTETDVNDLRGRWSNVQTGFVDEPRHAVEEADKLVATVMQRLAEGFANERSNLEKAWDRGDNVSTEDLRVALRRYRSFFDRLLNA